MESDGAETYAALIKHYRKRNRLTQEGLAERADVSRQTIVDIERGKTQKSRPAVMNRLAAALTLTDAERASLADATNSASIAQPTHPPMRSLREQTIEELSWDVAKYVRYPDALASLESKARWQRHLYNDHGVQRTTADIARALAALGRPEEAMIRIHELLGDDRRLIGDTLTSHVLEAVAFTLYVVGRYDEARIVADRGRDRALGEDEGDVLTRAVRLADVIGRELRITDFSPHARRGQNSITRLAPVFISAHGWLVNADDEPLLCAVLARVPDIHVERGEFDDSRVAADRAVTCAERAGDRILAAALEVRRCTPSLMIGSWRDAQATLERYPMGQDSPYMLDLNIYPLYCEGRVDLLRGMWDAASSRLERCFLDAGWAGFTHISRWCVRALAEVALISRQVDVIPERIGWMERTLAQSGTDEWDIIWFLPYLAWAYLETGDRYKAEARVKEAIQRATKAKHALALHDALWVRTKIEVRWNQFGQAAETLDEAFHLADNLGYSLGQARVEQTYGDLYAAQQQTRKARSHHIRAYLLFNSLGVRGECDRLPAQSDGGHINH